ncbi:MAG: DUF4272 domain-containing protein [Ruminococcus sp.]|nr:DUF4272 domain-containing protein [Ruminococcus sp.]
MTPEERKANSEKILTQKGVGFQEEIPPIKSADQVKLRSFDDICRRAIAALLSTQSAIELNDHNPEGMEKFKRLMVYFGVEECLNKYETLVMDNKASEQDLVNVVWEYESCWALFWALGLLDDITDATEICDCKTAIHFVSQCESLEDFKSQCSLRSIDEILDMADLYYRYDWACEHHDYIDSSWETGGLDKDIVYYRRLAIEWMKSSTDDWFDMSLDT